MSDSNYFSYDLTSVLSTIAPDIWNNITIPVGSGNWLSSNTAAKWENITSLTMNFDWSTSSNIELRVDGLFFRGIFKNAVELYGSQTVLLSFALSAATPFLFQWLLLTALMYLMIKSLLKGKVIWKALMVAVGLALITLVVQALLTLATYSTLAPVNVPLEYFAGIQGEFEAANQAILMALEQATSVSGIIQIVVYVWTIALGAFIVRDVSTTLAVSTGEMPSGTQTQFNWVKCLLVSAASFLLTLLILAFLGV
jgi:hypothetical protein